MKKWFILSVMLVAAVGLAACGGQQSAAPAGGESAQKAQPAEQQPAAKPAEEPAAKPAEQPATEPAAGQQKEMPAESSTPEGSAPPAAESGQESSSATPEPSANKGGDNAASLTNTVWTMDDYTISFYKAPDMHVEGGLAGAGINGTYELKGNDLSISVGGMDLGGTWDGKSLTIDGNPATKSTTKAAQAKTQAQ